MLISLRKSDIMPVNMNELDMISEALIKLDRMNVQEFNLKAAEYGFEKNKDLLSTFTFNQIEELTQAIIDHKSFTVDSYIYFFNGNSKYCNVLYKPEYNLLFITDKTDFELLKKVKSDFVTSISHELRTPLSVAKGNIQMLRDIQEDEKYVQNIKKVEKSISKIENIISQLTMLSMAELGLYSPKVDIFDPVKLYEEIYSDMEGKLNAKKIKVDFECTSPVMKEDRFIIYTILRNLMSNAIKYSYDNSKIEVHISDKNLAVRDFGIGIRKEELPRIFERFFRGVEAVKVAKGSGLGLAVVKHLCDLSGFKIKAESKWMVGSYFEVVIKD
jgi:two-component system OmpR family sensor kinase